MQFRLRTLVLLTAIAPPILAASWFWGWALLIAIWLSGLILIELVAVLLSAPLPILAFLAVAWLFSLIAKALLYFGRHPDNRT